LNVLDRSAIEALHRMEQVRKAREDRMRNALDVLAVALPNPGTSFKQWTRFVQRTAREGLGRDEPTNRGG
jgi:hypothetical protein